MKIKVNYDSENKLLRIPVILKAPHKRLVSEVIFDTGSPYTFLNYSDSLRLCIPHDNKSKIIRIGGRTYQSYLYEKFEIMFKSENNQSIVEILPVRILKPNSLKMEELKKLDRFPNILGIDFLELGWKFFCDVNNDNIYFEKD